MEEAASLTELQILIRLVLVFVGGMLAIGCLIGLVKGPPDDWKPSFNRTLTGKERMSAWRNERLWFFATSLFPIALGVFLPKLIHLIP